MKDRCRAELCSRSAKRSENGKLGFCSMHYQQFKKFGDCSVVNKPRTPALDWIEAHKGFQGDDCLSWPFSTGKDGYGRVHHRGGVLTTASRLMCITAHGEPPSAKMEAAHSCGNGHKACTNPQHLYWATSARNHADKLTHGTSNRGTRQGQSKLTEGDVITIRELAWTQSGASLAKKYKVTLGYIYKIKHKKAWTWLPAA